MKRVYLIIPILGVLSFVAALFVISAIERPKVIAAYEQIQRACEDQRYEEAYRMMTSDYRKRLTLSEFKEDVGDSMLSPNSSSPIILRQCSVWSESGWLTVGYIWHFRKEQGVWRCDGHGDTWFLD